MNRYGINTKDYGIVQKDAPKSQPEYPAYIRPSCFYDFAAPIPAGFVGYSDTHEEPSELFKEMQEACKKL